MKCRVYTRPTKGDKLIKVWEACDELHAAGGIVTVSAMREVLKDKIHPDTIRIQTCRWMDDNGIERENKRISK